MTPGLNSRRTRLTWLAVIISSIATALLATTLVTSATSARTVGSPVPSAAIPRLRAMTLALARLDGDRGPRSIAAVVTTRGAALRVATPGDTISYGGSRPVYLVLMVGKFTLTDVPVPPGAHSPTGRYLALTINSKTFKVMDIGLRDRPPPIPLSSYGPVRVLMSMGKV